jgi:hypothetical protein
MQQSWLPFGRFSQPPPLYARGYGTMGRAWHFRPLGMSLAYD